MGKISLSIHLSLISVLSIRSIPNQRLSSKVFERFPVNETTLLNDENMHLSNLNSKNIVVINTIFFFFFNKIMRALET